jgi:hypothetical protein
MTIVDYVKSIVCGIFKYKSVPGDERACALIAACRDKHYLHSSIWHIFTNYKKKQYAYIPLFLIPIITNKICCCMLHISATRFQKPVTAIEEHEYKF